MFFEASRFGCRKKNFDTTKVTYSTYSCTISDMLREMMKMDGRDSAEYQFSKKRDVMVIMGFDFKSLKDEIVNSSSSPSLSQKKNMGLILEIQ